MHPDIKFEVNDNFKIKVKDLGFTVEDTYYGGDRWSGPNIDARRASWTLAHIDGVTFLDYNKSMMENAYIISKSTKPFISTFTGISVLADLLGKEQYVLWGEDIRNWDNKPIEYSFDKHYYRDRGAKLMYLGDFKLESLHGNN
jgi:hypothetical protein